MTFKRIAKYGLVLFVAVHLVKFGVMYWLLGRLG